MQDFVSSVVGRRTAQIFFEEFVKVAGVVEANRGRKLGDGGKILLGIHQFFCGFIDSVFHQIFKRTHLQSPCKTAAAFAFTDMDAVGDFLER